MKNAGLICRNPVDCDDIFEDVKAALKKCAKHFDARKLFKKMKSTALKVGGKVIYNILQLWYVLQKPDVPYVVKLTIMGTLAYFVMPVDLAPDFIPGGFVDDIAAIAYALSFAAIYIDSDVNEKAGKKVVELMAPVVR